MLKALLLAVSIVSPPKGARVPALQTCYMMGSVPRGVTNLVVQGHAVDLYRTGAWVTMVSLQPGTNTIELIENGVATNHSFFVSSPQEAAPSDHKKFEKLPYAGDVARPHPRTKPIHEITIFLDPGHGGSDTGALSPHGHPEKDANLRIAREVRLALEEKGFRVKMTRTNDVARVLSDRAKEAHEVKADAFVSIHHNAHGYASDPRLSRYHTVYSWNAIGEALACAIHARMAETLEGDIPGRGPLHANYAVTRSPEIPSCLIEVDFLTTPEGEEAIWCQPRRRAIGQAIADGIADWCRE